MSKNKTLDIVFTIIDENIQEETAVICRKIYVETGYCDQDYNKFLAVSTADGITLKDYIRKHKLYFAAQELVNHPEKSITDIAVEYGYESSSLTRAIKQEYKRTPTELRKGGIKIPDNKLNSEKLLSGKSRLDAVLEKVISDIDYVSDADQDYFEEFAHATNEYGFGLSTCCLISELSEKLNIPFGYLPNQCFEMAIDCCPPKGELPEKYEYIIDLGIHNNDELEAILRYYKCEYYELTHEKVERYFDKHNKK